MIPLCVVTEGAWPSATGGLATWTHHLVESLPPGDVAVLSLGSEPESGLQHTVPSGVSVVERTPRLERVPAAERYLASGLEAAKALLALRPWQASRIAYVEHGDVVRELASAGATEGGRTVPLSDRQVLARIASRERREVAARVGLVVGVTRRTCERAAGEGARRVVHIPNAVPPLEGRPAAEPGVGLGFIGRMSSVKGVDRFSRLASRIGGQCRASVLSGPERCEVPRDSDVRWRFDAPDPWDELPALLAMPSRLEASPFVALEAEARGVPVLLSDAADLAESPLIRVRLWHLRSWAEEADRFLASRPAPGLGRACARRRWAGFKRAWSWVAAGRW